MGDLPLKSEETLHVELGNKMMKLGQLKMNDYMYQLHDQRILISWVANGYSRKHFVILLDMRNNFINQVFLLFIFFYSLSC